MRFHGKFHGQLIEYLLTVSVHDHIDRVLFADTTLLEVEQLIFTDLGGCGFVLYFGGVIFHFQIWEGMCAATVAHQQGITLGEVVGIFSFFTHFHQTAVGVVALTGGDTFGDDRTAGIFTQVDHFGTGIRLLAIIGNGYRIELTHGVVPFQDTTWIFPGNG